MKTLLIALGISLFCGLSANAADLQLQQCGDNLKQVQQIIKDDFPQFSTTYAERFVGTWGTSMTIDIDMYSPFTAMGYAFKVCPQSNGTFYIVAKSDPSIKGTLRLKNSKKIELSGFSSLVDGIYPKAGSAVATGRSGGDL